MSRPSLQSNSREGRATVQPSYVHIFDLWKASLAARASFLPFNLFSRTCLFVRSGGLWSHLRSESSPFSRLPNCAMPLLPPSQLFLEHATHEYHICRCYVQVLEGLYLHLHFDLNRSQYVYHTLITLLFRSSNCQLSKSSCFLFLALHRGTELIHERQSINLAPESFAEKIRFAAFSHGFPEHYINPLPLRVYC